MDNISKFKKKLKKMIEEINKYYKDVFVMMKNIDLEYDEPYLRRSDAYIYIEKVTINVLIQYGEKKEEICVSSEMDAYYDKIEQLKSLIYYSINDKFLNN